MRIHHLDCGSLNCIGGALAGGEGHVFRRHPFVCHVLLIESRDGLVLVDTGIGRGDLADPGRLGVSFNVGFKPALRDEVTAIAQVEALGFKAADVRHLVLTHLDIDHAGGLSDFPDATVHVHADEKSAADARRTMNERARYVPGQWAHPVKWRTYAGGGEAWNGFQGAHEIAGLGPDFLMVPLVGHSRGHAGIAVKGERGWLLHAGDAYFHRARVSPTGEGTPSGVAFFERTIAIDKERMIANQALLRALANDATAKVQIFSAHDVVEFNALVARARETARKAS